MSFNPFAARRLPPTTRRKPTRLRLEPLEDRRLPSTVLALTDQNQLLRFDSVAPDLILGSAPITGLQSGERVLGIDVRPATRELYALGSANRLYTVNPMTGAATLKAGLTADPTDTTNPFTTLTGTDFGVDFNPVPDRFRVVSDANQDLRINPDTGRVITDTTLAYDPGDASVGRAPDPNANRDPSVVDVAYTNNVAGATTTTLFGLDSGLNLLVRQGGPNGNPSPNLGQLFTIGPLTPSTAPAGFDIAPSGTAFAALDVRGPLGRASELVTVDLTSGARTGLGLIGDGTMLVQDIAVASSIQFSAKLLAVDEVAGGATLLVTRTEGSLGTISVDFATASGSAISGNDFLSTSGTLVFGPGETTRSVTIPILDDAIDEGDEFLTITLSNPTGGVVLGGPSTAVLRINANDRRDLTPPTVTGVGLLGPSQAVSGVLLRFSEDMNVIRSQDLGSYAAFGISPRGRRVRLALSSATYDAVQRSVTLMVAQPFALSQFRKLEIRAIGRGSRALTDLSGNRLDGDRNGRTGGNAVLRLKVASGPSLTVVDRDGDRATLRIQNVGTLQAVGLIGGDRASLPQILLVTPIAPRSTLTGFVRRSSRGDGIVNLQEITGIDRAFFRPDFLQGIRVKTLTFNDRARVMA